MATENESERKESDVIICKSTLSDSFLLYLINESSALQNIRPYEHSFLHNHKKFQLNKHILIEIYLGLQRLIKRNKIKKWRKFSNEVSKNMQHETYRPLISKLIYTLTLKLCNLPKIQISDTLINKFYDEIHCIHQKASSLNTKTRILYLREPYIFGQNNVNFSSKQTQKNFEIYQNMSQRNGLSNDQNPFKKFKFSLSIEKLLTLERTKCVYCGKRSALYCAYCQYAFCTKFKWPNLCLPVNVDIIRHPKEMINVCSSVHSCVIAPRFVQMYEFPKVPALSKEDGVFLLYPSENAIFLDEFDDLTKIKKIVVIESRWRGNTPIYKHDELKNLPHCKIRNRETLYWRYQEKSKEYLATIEAIYYGVVDVWKAKNKNKEYDGRFDDLLMLFAYEHEMKNFLLHRSMSAGDVRKDLSPNEMNRDDLQRKLMQKEKEFNALQKKYESLNALYRELENNQNEQSKIHKLQIEALKAENKKLSKMNENDHWIKLDKIHTKNEKKIKKLKEEIADWKTKCNELRKNEKNMEHSKKHKTALLQIAQLKSQKSLTSNQKKIKKSQKNEQKTKINYKDKYENLLSEYNELRKNLQLQPKEKSLSDLFEQKCSKQRDFYKVQINEMKDKYIDFLNNFKRLKQQNKDLMSENESLYKIKHEINKFV